MRYDRKPGMEVRNPLALAVIVVGLLLVEGMLVAYLMGWLG